MKILFATAEIAPWMKTGGLGDVAAALPPALRATGLDADLDPWLTPPVLARVAVDKKRTGGRLAFVACAAPGDCQVVDLPTTAIADLLRP